MHTSDQGTEDNAACFRSNIVVKQSTKNYQQKIMDNVFISLIASCQQQLFAPKHYDALLPQQKFKEIKMVMSVEKELKKPTKKKQVMQLKLT